MSIMHEGGLEDPPQKDTQLRQDSDQDVRNAFPEHPRHQSRNPTCKICDRGTLISKKAFRMSGPVVAIGFILLVPSFIGMIICAIMLVSVSSVGSPKPYQSAEDAKFRKDCKESFLEVNSQLPGVSAPQYCECLLSTYKATDSLEGAGRTCAQQGLDGTLKTPDHDVDAFYSSDVSDTRQARDNYRQRSEAFYLFLGVLFFVGGLLGWLLVMKKRVLQCDVCGAVVNAS